MDNHIEKLVAEGKALVGYDQDDVKEEITSLQSKYNEKKERLVQEIKRLRAENVLLKEKLDNKIEEPATNYTMEDLSKKIINVFLEDTLVIENLKKELEMEEKKYLESLQLRRNQKELAKQGIKEAADFLKSLQEDFSILKKEMDE